MLSRLPRSAAVWLDRLSGWLELFEVCFPHVAQRSAFRRYLLGLLSDSHRKSMSAMLERVRDPGTYQTFEHVITDAPWSAERKHTMSNYASDGDGTKLHCPSCTAPAARAATRTATFAYLECCVCSEIWPIPERRRYPREWFDSVAIPTRTPR